MSRVPLVAVIGGGTAADEVAAVARAIGAAIAQRGFGIVCGGLGGVMEAACRGAASVPATERGPIVGILPGYDATAANHWVEVALPTGLSLARNVLVVASADAVVAVDGESGTLSEIALAWQMGKPIGAFAGADGWAAKLGNVRLDERHERPIERLHDVEALHAWLEQTLPR